MCKRDTTIIRELEEREELLKKIKEMKERVSIIEESVKDSLGGEGVKNYGPYTVTLKEVKSNRFDSKSFKSEHSDLYNDYIKESVSYRFSVKV
jgi:predicted phage-related endonuclease